MRTVTCPAVTVIRVSVTMPVPSAAIIIRTANLNDGTIAAINNRRTDVGRRCYQNRNGNPDCNRNTGCGGGGAQQYRRARQYSRDCSNKSFFHDYDPLTLVGQNGPDPYETIIAPDRLRNKIRIETKCISNILCQHILIRLAPHTHTRCQVRAMSVARCALSRLRYFVATIKEITLPETQTRSCSRSISAMRSVSFPSHG